MHLTTPLSRAYWEQKECHSATEMLLTTSSEDCKFCAVSVEETTENFSYMFIYF